jgi:hypothetical protein
MVNLLSTSYGSCLQKLKHTSADFSATHVVWEKLVAIHDDPFAMELAFRLAIADLSYLLGESFQGCYRGYSQQHRHNQKGEHRNRNETMPRSGRTIPMGATKAASGGVRSFNIV